MALCAGCMAMLVLPPTVIQTMSLRRSERLGSLQQELEASAEIAGLTPRIDALRDLAGRETFEASAGGAALLQVLSGKLNALQVADRSLRMEPPSAAGPLDRHALRLEFRCSFAVLFELLVWLQDEPRLIRLDRLSVRRDPTSPVDFLSVELRLAGFSDPQR